MKKLFLLMTLQFMVAANVQALSFDQLKEASEKYIDTLNIAGRMDANALAKRLPQVVTSKCQKIMNGKTATTDIVQLQFQLKDVINMAGAFTIDLLDTIPSPQDSASVVRYVLNSTYKGKFTTIAILRFNEDGLITEINEVYNRFEG